MQGTKHHMTEALVCVGNDMRIICSGIVVRLQVDPVDECGWRTVQDGIHTGEVVWHYMEASFGLSGIGLTEPLGALPVVFHSVGVTDVEGQLYTARGKHLEAIALVGLEGLWGKVWVIVFIHLGNHSSQYKSTPGQLLGWG